MPYGSVTNVAVLASTRTKNGVFSNPDIYGAGGTTPSLTQVEAWIVQLSHVADFAIAQEGFATPVTNPTAVAVIAHEVEKAVADLCHAAHKSGRFYSKRALEPGSNLATNHMTEWVKTYVVAFQTLGIPTATNAVGDSMASLDVI